MTARVLVVDDVSFNVKLLQTKLEQEYYEVFIASDGLEAIEKTKEVQPDIILMDVMMPGMDGFEATRIIKSDNSISYIPIIMVTALNAQQDKVRGLESGADDFLTKPINDQALIARLKSLVRLKFMTDELRIRNATGKEFGITNIPNITLQYDIRGSSVLLVDDDVAQIKKITSKLEEKGVILDNTVSVEEAYRMSTSKDYDLIIVSTQLMDGDGLRLCSHIKSQNELRSTPILIMVDENETKVLSMGFEIGVADYMLTPVDPNELLARTSTQIRRKKFQDALKNSYLQSMTLSVTDPLTHLSNRRYFDIHTKNLLDRAKEQNKSISMLMIDIDHFKSINDTYGHQAGDMVLQEVANQILNNVRVSDLCARFGGEEFVVVMPGADAKESMSVAERIRSAIANTQFKLPNSEQTIQSSCSIGLAVIKEGDSVESMLSRADKALYKAKETGRNKVCLE
jgi:two-component system, cell cycle response regulator